MWTYLILASAVGLGLYDIGKKHAVHGNAVLPVLLLGTLCGSSAFIAALAAAGRLGAALSVGQVDWWLILIKSGLVTASWIFAYYAMRSLPISIASPIRGSQPLWTVLGAFIVFREVPAGMQWAGMGVIFGGYALFSLAGRQEGIHFARHRGVFCLFAGTFLGAVSGLYDKFLLQTRALAPETVQAWFSIELVWFIGAALLVQRLAGWQRTPFQWRWSIPLVGLLLVASDWLYFTALSDPDTKISILSLIRRSNCVISFTLGGALFQETNKTRKAVAMAFILAGVALLCL